MAIRYERPSAELAGYITGYHLYAARARPGGQVDWFLPGTANVRVCVHAGPVSVRIGHHRFDPIPIVSLFGPTSRALEAVTFGGAIAGFGVSALGWARLSRQPADGFHNRIVPLGNLFGPGLDERLRTGLEGLLDEHGLKHLLDGILAPLFAGDPHPDEPMIRAIMEMIVHDGDTEIAGAADRLGISAHTLRRASQRYFGMTPKLLLRRARFLRSLTRLLQADDTADYRLIDPSYHDVPHFLRDADAFLGMTPRRFKALSPPFLVASLRARTAVLGTPTQALHDPVADLSR